MDELQNVLSVINIVVVLIAVYYEFILNRFINYEVDETNYYRTLYNDYLITKIPDALNNIKKDIKDLYQNNDDKHILILDEVLQVIDEMRKASFFAKYEDIKFYNEMEKAIIEIEDFCDKIQDCEFDISDASMQYMLLDKKIANLYSVILRKKLVKKFSKKIFLKKKQ